VKSVAAILYASKLPAYTDKIIPGHITKSKKKLTVFNRHPERSRGIWLHNYIQHRESSIQYRVFSIKNADTSEQKSKFSKIF